ncbi:hypothetical protein [Vibrio phage R01]|nr:hypothetical protein [Vibrio phage R01]
MAKQKKPVNPWKVVGSEIYYRGELAARMTSVMGDDVVLAVLSKFHAIAENDTDRLMEAVNSRQEDFMPPSLTPTMH